MADAISQLFVNLDLRTKDFASGVADAQREGRALEKVFKPISTTMKDVGAAMTATGAAATAGVTVPLVALGAAAIKFGGDFEDAMTQSLAIMGNVSDSMKNELGNAAKDMAKTTVFSAKEGAEALFFLSSSGLDAAASMKALPAVANFAQAGVLGLAQSTEFLTDAQAALGLSVKNDAVKNMENMVRVSDVLVKANVLSNATTQQFAEALTNKAAGALRLVGKEVEEGTAVLAAFASQGVKGAVAGEQLAIVMRDLQAKAISNKDEFKQLGLRVFDASGDMRNMADIVGNLETLLAGMSDEQKKATLTMLGFQDRSVGAMLQLVGTSDAIRGYEQALKSAGGATAEISGKQMESFKNQMKLLSHQVELLGITLFEAIAPVLKDIVLPALQSAAGGLQKLAEWFGALPKPVQTVAIALAVVAAAVGPVLVGAGFMVTQVGALIPIFLRLAPLIGLSVPPIAAVGTASAAATTPVAALSASLFTAAGAWAAFTAALNVVAVLAAAAAIYKIVEAYAAYRGAVGEAVQANKTAEASTDALAAKLAASGIVIEKAGESLSQVTREQDFFLMSQGVAVEKAARSFGQYHAEVVEAAATAAWFEQVSKKVASATTASGKATGDMGAAAKAAGSALEDMGEKAKKAGEKAADAAQKARDQMASLAHFLRGAQDNFERPIKGLNAQLVLLSTNVDIATPKLKAMAGPVISEMELLDDHLKRNSAFVLRQATDEAAMFAARDRDLKNHTKSVSASTNEWQRVWETAVGNIVSNFSKGVTDLLLHGKKFSVDLKGIFSQLGESLTQIMVTNAFTPIFKAFNDLLSSLTKPITDWISGFISRVTKPLTDALSGLIGGVTDSLTGGLSKAVSSSISGALPGSASIPGVDGAGGAVGGIAGGASSLAGSFISGGLAAVGSIVGSLISKGNQQRTEENTRESRDWLELMAVAWDPIFNLSMNYLKQIEAHTRVLGEWLLPSMEFWGQKIVDTIGQISTTVGGVVTKVTDRALEASSLVANEVVDAIADVTTTIAGFLNFGVPKFEEAVIKGFLNFGVPKFEEALDVIADLTAAITESLPAGTGGTSFLNFGVPDTGARAGTTGTPFLNFGMPKFEEALVEAVTSIKAPTANVPPPELFGADAYARVIPTLFGTHAYSGVATPVAPAAMPAVNQTSTITVPTSLSISLEINGARDPKATRDEVIEAIDRNTDSFATKIAERMKEILPGIVTVPA